MPLIRAFTLLQCLINANDNRIPVCQVFFIHFTVYTYVPMVYAPQL